MQLQIENIHIKADNQGRYSLNDLFLATKTTAERNRPKEYLKFSKTQEYVDFLTDSKRGSKPHLKPVKTAKGRYGGTFICEELVYDYAMYVSAEFKHKVITAFKNSSKAESTLTDLVSDLETKALSISKRIDAATVTMEELKGHGKNWGAYGAQIKKAKRESISLLEELKDEIQMKLDFMG